MIGTRRYYCKTTNEKNTSKELEAKKVTILLSTYNGATHLQELLDSLFAQTHTALKILARDDVSDCDSVAILESYGVELIKTNENIGAKASFAELLSYGLQNSESDYFMFCDQDDVWHHDKVEKSLAKMLEMEKKYSETPLLVHTDLEVVDEKLGIIDSSFMNFQKINPLKNKFHHLLLQNTVTGCTIMLNRKLAEKSLPIPDAGIMHDWWIALVASKFGKIGYLDEATIKYRQHTNNTIGAKGFDLSFVLSSISKKISLGGNISQSKAFLEQFRLDLDAVSIKMLEDFSSLEDKSWSQKRFLLLRYRLLKQGVIRNVGLLLKL